MRATTFISTLLVVGIAVCARFARAEDNPIPKKLKGVPSKGALVYLQPSGPKAYKYTPINSFPGTKFYSTVCGGPNVDREATISANVLSYRQNRGPSGNSMRINYFFQSAKLQVLITETFGTKVLVNNVYELSALLDKASDKQIQKFTTEARKAAISAIETVIAQLDKFTSPNQEAACMAFITGPAKNPFQPYSPDLQTTIKYFTTIKNTLAAFKPAK